MRKPVAFISVLAPGVAILMPDAAAREPVPIETCQTISQPGSYELANNLTATGDCLVITTDFVTIDLGGFSISGATTGVGIWARPTVRRILHGLTVRNGSLSGFDVGVTLAAAEGSIVEELHIFGGPGTTYGIFARGIVRNNAVISIVGGDGIAGFGAMTGNYVASNRQGMSLDPGSTVIGDTAWNNDVGLSVGCPSNVIENTASGNITSNLILNGEGCNNTNNVAP